MDAIFGDVKAECIVLYVCNQISELNTIYVLMRIMNCWL